MATELMDYLELFVHTQLHSSLQWAVWALFGLYGSCAMVLLLCSASYVPERQKNQVSEPRRSSQGKEERLRENGNRGGEGSELSSLYPQPASLTPFPSPPALSAREASRMEGGMKNLQTFYSQSSTHRSLQRPGKKSTAAEGSSPTPVSNNSKDDSSVVWLGRYPQSFIAAGPISVVGAASTYELSDDLQQSLRGVLQRKYGERAHWAATIIQKAYRSYCMEKKFRQVRSSALRKFARLQSQESTGGLRSEKKQQATYFHGHPYRHGVPHVFMPSMESRSPAHRYPMQNGLASPPVSRHSRPVVTASSRGEVISPRGSPSRVPTYSSVGLRLHRYHAGAHEQAQIPRREFASNGMNPVVRVRSGDLHQPRQHVPHQQLRHNSSTGAYQSAYGSQEHLQSHQHHQPVASNMIQVRVSKGVRTQAPQITSQQSYSAAQPPVVKVSQGTRHRSTSAERTSSGTRVIAFAPGYYGGNEQGRGRKSSESGPSRSQEMSHHQPVFRGVSASKAEEGGKAEGSSSHYSEHYDRVPAAPHGPSGSHDYSYMTGAQYSPNRDFYSSERPASSRSGSEAETPTSSSDLSLGLPAPNSPRISKGRQGPVWVPQSSRSHGGNREESPIPPLRHLPSSDALLTRSIPDSKALAVKVLPTEGHSKPQGSKNSEIQRKRQYRIALNFFNKKPDRGMQFLIDLNFANNDPSSVAKFLMTRRGLSKQMIGEYLGNLQNSFNGAVLEAFVGEMDFHGMEIDVALRKFQSYFRLPGEAQKIERIMEVFAHRFLECNPSVRTQFQSQDTIFILAFAVIMLNTDLHSPNIKPERRMKLEDFVKNLRGIDGGRDVDPPYLAALYRRIKEEEFRSGTDHTTQVVKVDLSVAGKKPTLSLPHRRLVCYCRLYEIEDRSKKQSPTVHQREIFLFNDLILITKIINRKKNVVTYSYRQSHSLVGMKVQSFKNQYYQHGLELQHTLENKTILFHARSEDDKIRFLEDLRESIIESDEMEALRIELELEKQSLIRPGVNTLTRTECQRDSGLPDLSSEDNPTGGPLGVKHRALSNSMLELAADPAPAPSSTRPMHSNEENRRASLNSLDSGMSSTASVGSRESSPQSASGEKARMGRSHKGPPPPPPRH